MASLSVASDVLRGLKDQGVSSDIMDLRLEYMELEGIARYVRGIVEKRQKRVYPRMLPTQASGRWSTTNPPLVNFPAHAEDDCDRCKRGEPLVTFPDAGPWCPRDVRAIRLPDPGYYWVHFDLDGIEGRFAAAYSHDEDELEAYRQKWDLHSLNACGMWRIPRPPVLTKKMHTDPSCEAWRQAWNPPWSGSDDRRRHLAKTLKYALQFAKDHRGANESKDVEKLKLTKKELEAFAKMYLQAKIALTSHKAKRFEECARTNVSYTFRGRRRRLFGDAWTRAKVGWSHEVQGSVPDIMNDYIIQIDQAIRDGWLVLNAHDGLEWAVPVSVPEAEAIAIVKKIVEREWDVKGTKMPVSGAFEVIRADGTKVAY